MAACNKKRLVNWSGTVRADVSDYHEPESVEELADIVRRSHKVRVVGAYMSPYGVAVNEEEEGDATVAVVCMRRFDKVLNVDAEKMTVVVEAGIKVEDLVARLEAHGMTLPGFPFIQGMTIGGLVQTGSHGSGTHRPAFDAMVIAMRVMNCKGEVVELTEKADGELFLAARCALGCFGPVVQVTLRCVPVCRLKAGIRVTELKDLREVLRLVGCKDTSVQLLPHTGGKVVVFTHEKMVKEDYEEELRKKREQTQKKPTNQEMMSAKRDLLRIYFDLLDETSFDKGHGFDAFARKHASLGLDEVKLEIFRRAPTDLAVLKRLYRAEAAYWTEFGETFEQVGFSQHLLMVLDFKAPHLVKELCVSATGGGRGAGGGGGGGGGGRRKDLEFMESVLAITEEIGVAAHTPLLCRWSPASRSILSPLYSEEGEEDYFVWVQLLLFTTGDEDRDVELRSAMDAWYLAISERLGDRHGVNEHLAKIEWKPETAAGALETWRRRNRERLGRFNRLRREFDPEGKFSAPNVAFITT